MYNKELEVRCFLEEAKNISIEVNTSVMKTKQYILRFDKIKKYSTTEKNLTISNKNFEVLNVIINWIKIKIIKNKLVIPVYDGEIIIEEF